MSLLPASEPLREELRAACRNLEERLKMVGLESRRLPPDAWDSLSRTLPTPVAEWIVSICADFALQRALLTSMPEILDAPVNFRLYPPQKLIEFAQPDHYLFTLFSNGYYLLAEDTDENFWVCRAAEGPGCAIFWFNFGMWNGTAAGITEALVFASSRLALLLCSMELAESDFDRPSAIMWVPDLKYEATRRPPLPEGLHPPWAENG